ncbi:hypothetical protein BTN49_1051 [Candidatus Enterovibrio escicola]|uniref:Uncharacterized protein n=1 Tax=Candidatus Enterovibrio escicola TaxID=1927127 RepID=A0A2A5T4G6_9GAMM|nr:hypothetical protein BTN49_1051 [Candidatus Enterovibrio escacola]
MRAFEKCDGKATRCAFASQKMQARYVSLDSLTLPQGGRK